MAMDLRQLRSFTAVARHRSFSRAAGELFLGQPAVSQHVRRLEDEVGLELLRRTTRSVELTDAGRLFLPRAERALAEVEAGIAELEEIRGLLRGRLRIGAMQSLEPYDLPGALAAFHQAHRDIDITVVEESSRDMVAGLLADALDAAFVPVGDGLPVGLDHHELFSDELVLIAGPDSPLAARGAIGMKELRDEDFVFLREGSTLRREIETAARAAGFEPHAGFETNELARVVALVAKGLGVSVVPRALAEREREAVRLVPLDPPVGRTVALVWRADRHQPPAARAFIEHVRSLPPVPGAATPRGWYHPAPT